MRLYVQANYFFVSKVKQQLKNITKIIITIIITAVPAVNVNFINTGL